VKCVFGVEISLALLTLFRVRDWRSKLVGIEIAAASFAVVRRCDGSRASDVCEVNVVFLVSRRLATSEILSRVSMSLQCEDTVRAE